MKNYLLEGKKDMQDVNYDDENNDLMNGYNSVIFFINFIIDDIVLYF